MESKAKLSDLLATALGPEANALLQDPTISEIRLNSDGCLWANRLGQGKFHTGARVSAENARRIIQTVAYSVQDVCQEQKPSVSAELPGSGERFQGILPPLSKAPVIVVRKRATRIFTLANLATQGVLPEPYVGPLTRAVLQRRNILVVGGTDSGKTTFANALLQVIAETNDRIVIIEDTQELQCQGRDVEYLRTKDGIASLEI